MRIFAGRGQLASLSLEARVLYTAFALFLLVGYGSSLWLYADGIGFSNASVQRWYRGGEVPAAQDAGGGPALELPDEGAPAEVAIEKPARQLAETFHFHLFTVPVVLLIVGHLFMLCRIGTGWKVSVIAITSLATLAHLFAPLAVRFVSPSLAFLMPATGLPMAAGFVYMTARPIFDMWRPKPKPLVRPGGDVLDHSHSPVDRG